MKRIIQVLLESSKDTIKITPIEVIPSYVSDLIYLVQFLIDNAPYVQSYLLVDDSVQRASLKRTPKSFREFARSGIQAKRIEEMNKLLLMVLYERRPLEITFQNFI